MFKTDYAHLMSKLHFFSLKKRMWYCILTIMTLLFSTPFTSCNKHNDDFETLEPELPTSGITATELKGVWTTTDGSDFYFIYFDGINDYSMCLNNRIMGAGSYDIKNNHLTLKNQYLKNIDEVSVTIINGKLNMRGYMTSFNGIGKENIDIVFSKTNEAPPTSIVGKIWHSGWILAEPTDYKEYLEFVSNYTAKFYRIRDNYLNEKYSEYFLYYIHRNGLIYTQRVDGNGSVNIYKLSFNSFFTLGDSLSENKVN